ncbi:MAG: galactose-1-phosphate uridylyltransferase [Nitrospirae bacterium]|nr:galactose-1-phosphate uridylyltransferase [Nitrospirota bacterium]
MSEIRKNLITGEYVILAPERAKRPSDFECPVKHEAPPERVDNCPFCPGNEDKTPPHNYICPDSGAWTCRCIPNKFSALSSEGDMWRNEEGLKVVMAGVGRHEVVIETPYHNRCLAVLPDEAMKCYMSTCLHRFNAFYADPRVEHVILFKNHGAAAGTSLEHPHSQIVGLPMTPAQVRHRAQDACDYFDDKGSCLVCRTIEEEASDGRRVIMETDNFLAFIPYAALSPFHTWIFPKRHMPCFTAITGTELDELAVVLKTVLWKVYKGLCNPDYNYVIRSGAPSDCNADHLHWYVAIVPRVTKAAGFELGTGMYINPSIPEASAEFLRDVK